MILGAHAIIGGVVGEASGNPLPAFIIGFLLHYVLDAIPHFDSFENGKIYTTKQIIFTVSEFTLGMIYIFFVLRPTLSISSPFLWGSIGCMLPDMLDYFPLWSRQWRGTKIGHSLSTFHRRIHSKNDPTLVQGILIQLAIIAFFIFAFR